ncbi:MAG: hypothetical protein Q8N23_27080 [Archangium sp.]|nr:hypothetical protein [Archangium sp.]MDP3156370.1 hypothetical protein [Archangium sp.]MDP3570414.1 hypothetical protein [Archangium sp.]
MDRLSTDLSEELAELRARLASLEAERTASRGRVRWAGAAVVIAALIGTAASAANGACPNGLPFCFNSNTPALASEVNTNFSQLKEWLESKVGTVAAPVRITTGATVSTITPPTQASRALFVSANTSGHTEPIVDFRHDNLTQGVGIGWSSVVATGTATNQDLFLVPKGTGQVVVAPSNLNVGASAVSCAVGPCYCTGGMYPLSHTGTCNGAGIGVYSVLPVTLNGQRGIDVQCITSNFAGFAPMRNMVLTCSRLMTQ